MINSLDTQYCNLLFNIREKGTWEQNRTGIDTKTLVGAMIQHDMAEGFPILTVKRVPFKSMAVELKGFINGVTSKAWYAERGCNIWNAWSNPTKVPYGTDKAAQDAMAAEDDLGPIYGYQFRNFNKEYGSAGYGDSNSSADQLNNVISSLKKDPTNRRAICSAWNPLQLHEMALPPCHVLWQAMIVNNKLCLTWYQRSVDVPLGLPFNIASYGLLLHLLAKELGVAEGTLTGMLNNVHYYRNQEEGVNEIIDRGKSWLTKVEDKRIQLAVRPDWTGDMSKLPTIHTPGFKSIFTWDHSMSSLGDYNPHPTIKIPVAV